MFGAMGCPAARAAGHLLVFRSSGLWRFRFADWCILQKQGSPAMSYIRAIFRHGVFEPLEPVNFHEEQPVALTIEPVVDAAPLAWLDRVRAIQAAIVQRSGPLPDSSRDIAADR